MNQAQKRAIMREIAAVEDDMYRRKREQQAAGSNLDIACVIVEHELEIAELKEGL